MRVSKIASSTACSFVLASLLLTGCATDGKDGKDGNVDEVSITAVDGYIIGANVTDANGNVAFRNGDGTYSFVKAPKYPITLSGGKLKDTNETFTGTLRAAEGLVVSPITTLLTEKDEFGNYLDQVDTTTLDKLAAISGIAKEELVKDYMAAGNVAVAKVAQLLQVMNQSSDLMNEFETQVDDSNSTGGFNALKTIAESVIDSETATGNLSAVKQAVYKNILKDVANFSANDPSTIETALQDTKVALSNINAIETLGGEIGMDPTALQTAAVLVEIAGDPESTQTLSAQQLAALGANDVVTENDTLVAMMNDIIKNRNSINSKAEVTAYANLLRDLYQVDLKADGNSVDIATLKSTVEALTGLTFDSYQSYELNTLLRADTTLIADTLDKLTNIVENLTTYTLPTIS
ncbi:MAG: hypothetical protein IE909_15860, partial [Campylobacterales bacterium]|nr:hypothetical protein [Campylobacterales bacterium]